MNVVIYQGYGSGRRLVGYTEKSAEEFYDAKYRERRQAYKYTPMRPPTRGELKKRYEFYDLSVLEETIDQLDGEGSAEDWIEAVLEVGYYPGNWLDFYAPLAILAGMEPGEAAELLDEKYHKHRIDRAQDAFIEAAGLTDGDLEAFNHGWKEIWEL